VEQYRRERSKMYGQLFSKLAWLLLFFLIVGQYAFGWLVSLTQRCVLSQKPNKGLHSSAFFRTVSRTQTPNPFCSEVQR